MRVSTSQIYSIATLGMTQAQAAVTKTQEQMATGKRVLSPADDPVAATSILQLNQELARTEQYKKNINVAENSLNLEDTNLQTVSDLVQRMRELAVQSKNGTNTADDRTALNSEYKELAAEVTRLGTATKFNGTAVFGSGSITFQIGADATDTLSVNRVAAATISGDLQSTANATTALGALDTALTTVNTNRATLGAYQNRFESVIGNLRVSAENQASARGRIMDADFAQETANLSRTQILQQAGTAMVAQANQMPQGVLSLLR